MSLKLQIKKDETQPIKKNDNVKKRGLFRAIEQWEYNQESKNIDDQLDWWSQWLTEKSVSPSCYNYILLFSSAFEFYLNYKKKLTDTDQMKHWALIVDTKDVLNQGCEIYSMSEHFEIFAENQLIKDYLSKPVDEYCFLLIFISPTQDLTTTNSSTSPIATSPIVTSPIATSPIDTQKDIQNPKKWFTFAFTKYHKPEFYVVTRSLFAEENSQVVYFEHKHATQTGDVEQLRTKIDVGTSVFEADHIVHSFTSQLARGRVGNSAVLKNDYEP